MGDWKIAKFEVSAIFSSLAPLATMAIASGNSGTSDEGESHYSFTAILVLRKMDYTHNQKLADCIMQCKHS